MSKLPLKLREYLRQKNRDLAVVVDFFWNISSPIHERQNYPDSSENGAVHVGAVEDNIWRLLQTTTLPNKANNLDAFSDFELFLLSCAACCHDFDKALKSALPDTLGFVHGEGSGDFVAKNLEKLGLTRPQASAIQKVVSIHDLKEIEFKKELKKLKTNQAAPTPYGPYTLQRLAVLLKAADIMHCDNSRIPRLGVDPSKLEGLDRKKYLTRHCTHGWYPDGTRIFIQAEPGNQEEEDAVRECFDFMRDYEWSAVSEALQQYRFPYQLELQISDEQKLLQNYLKSIVVETKRIDMKGIYSRSGSSREAIHFPIEDIYTPLKTHQPRMEREDLESQAQWEREAQRIPLTDMLSKHRRLLLIGEAGGGKTTFLKLIACVLSKDALGETDQGRKQHLGMSLSKPAPVPIFMRLAALADVIKDESAASGSGASWRCIEKALEKIWGRGQADRLQNRLSEGNCALLLDGLDEVADENLRCRIVEVVNSAMERWGKNLIVLSSRPFGYHDIAGLEQMATVRIDAFGKAEIIEFLKRWGEGLYQDTEDKNSAEYLQELQSAIINSFPIRKLAHNPVMLTCLCVVHWNERKLPEGKADLLAAVLRWLLNAKEEKRKERGYHNTFAEECFKSIAFEMTCHPDGKQVIVDLAWAADQLEKPFANILRIEGNERVQSEGRRFLEEEMIDSGIIEKYGEGQLRFWHLSFQEHYAARALVDRSDDEWWKIIETKLYDRQWTEVIDHLAGCLAWTGLYRLNLLVERILGTANQHDLSSIARVVGMLGRILRILAVYDNYQPPVTLGWETVRDRVMEIFEPQGAAKVQVEQRIAAAEALGLAGDPRIDAANPTMLQIPGIPDILLGKYLVTVEEYRRFVESEGYKDEQYWKEWWDAKNKRGWKEPEGWDEQLEYLNRPVIGVSWYEAVAYCNWLAVQTGLLFRLPKSDEWEKAATNQNGAYPWGIAEPNLELCNFNMNVRAPTPVGIYPAGAVPGGHLDMVGNVMEWNDDEAGGSDRVIRGGGWGSDAQYCRSANRYGYGPGGRYDGVGFRLARSVAPGT